MACCGLKKVRDGIMFGACDFAYLVSSFYLSTRTLFSKSFNVHQFPLREWLPSLAVAITLSFIVDQAQPFNPLDGAAIVPLWASCSAFERRHVWIIICDSQHQLQPLSYFQDSLACFLARPTSFDEDERR